MGKGWQTVGQVHDPPAAENGWVERGHASAKWGVGQLRGGGWGEGVGREGVLIWAMLGGRGSAIWNARPKGAEGGGAGPC